MIFNLFHLMAHWKISKSPHHFFDHWQAYHAAHMELKSRSCPTPESPMAHLRSSEIETEGWASWAQCLKLPFLLITRLAKCPSLCVWRFSLLTIRRGMASKSKPLGEHIQHYCKQGALCLQCNNIPKCGALFFFIRVNGKGCCWGLSLGWSKTCPLLIPKTKNPTCTFSIRHLS